MQSTNYLNHPTEEALERFVLQTARNDELADVETHILACESCIVRLEITEVMIAACQLALRALQAERSEKTLARKRHYQERSWCRVPAFSGAVTVFLVVGLVISFVLHRDNPAANVTLSTYRGAESSIAPADHPLRLHLNAPDLADEPIFIQVVNVVGHEVWKGTASVHHNEVDVIIPGISSNGTHFLRLYRGATGHAEGELLREFAFQVQ